MEHVMQMRRGEAWYDNNNVYHKPNLSEPIQVYKRVINYSKVDLKYRLLKLKESLPICLFSSLSHQPVIIHYFLTPK